MNSNEAFVEYLKAGNFKRFMSAWRSQVKRLGHLGGSITLLLNDDNREDICGLLGKDYYYQNKVKITWLTFQKAILNSRFETSDFMQVLAMYFQGEIISNKCVKEQKEQQIKQFLFDMEEQFLNTKAAQWLSYVKIENKSVFSKMKQAIIQDEVVFRKQLSWVMEGINALPGWHKQSKNIAFFASEITGDPHAFDNGGILQYYLLHALCYFQNIPYGKMNNIEKNELLYQVGLYKDSVSNFCVIAHINAFINNDTYHPAWAGFYQYYEAWNINVDNIQAITSLDSNTCKKVFVIENPSIFQSLVAYAKANKINDIGFLCTNGQLNYCGYLIMDKLYESHIMMMYSGDMDPEGLLIVDKLKSRYHDLLTLWHYTISDYETAKSRKFASEKRLAMLNQLKHEDLQKIGQHLDKEPIGYQENLLNVYLQDLSQYM